MRTFVLALALVVAAGLLAPSAYAQFQEPPEDDDPATAPIDLPGNDDRNKVAQTSMQFLTVSTDPRSAALADAVVATNQGAVAMLYNPAGMGFVDRAVDAAVGRANWLGDISYNFGALSYSPSNGEYGTVGVSVVAVDYGEVQGTVRYNNEKGYLDLENPIEPTALSAGASYARALSNQFTVGGTVKYVTQNLGSAYLGFDEGGDLGSGAKSDELQEGTTAFDFGVLYRTGFRSLNLGFSARNFASELRYAEKSFELPLTFQLGVSMDLLDFTAMNQEMHSLRVSVEGAHPRAYSEQLKVGGEYEFMNLLSFRAGYIYPHDMQGVNLGAGLQQEFGGSNVSFDYSYTEFGFLGDVHRVALRFGFE